MISQHLILRIACTAVLVALSCSTQRLAGGSSQQGNGMVVGRVVNASGASIAGATVELLPALYDPVADAAIPDSFITTSDSSGGYGVRLPRRGNYNVEVFQNHQEPAAFVTGISFSAADTLLVPPAVVENPGFVRIFLPDSVDTVNGYFYIPGSTFALFVARGSGVDLLGPVPPGTISRILYKVKNSSAPARIIAESLLVQSSDTSTIAFSDWKSSRKLVLNTTPSGAAVSGTVVGFPVLVRLAGPNFNFSQAQANGSDIRFTKADGTPLPYEIEEWNASQGEAAVWVKADTVYGNNASQYFVMYWGNPHAVSVSNGAVVFDTSNGFQGVWHLGEASGTASDATSNHFDGTLSDTAPVATPGNIGGCRQFNGVSNYIQMPGTASGKLNFPAQGSYSLSAWVYADTLDTLYARIICKNNYQYKLQVDYFKDWSFAEYEDAVGFDLTNAPATAGAWVHLAGVRSGNSQYLYVNGVCVNSTITPQPYAAARDTTSDVTIGRSAKTPPGDPCFFNGRIDEARIESMARSADWVKLNYMNQKSPDALVTFK